MLAQGLQDAFLPGGTVFLGKDGFRNDLSVFHCEDAPGTGGDFRVVGERQEIAKSFQFVADRDVCLTQDASDPFFLPVRIRAIADRNLQINR